MWCCSPAAFEWVISMRFPEYDVKGRNRYSLSLRFHTASSYAFPPQKRKQIVSACRNPVSSYVLFELMVKPLLYQMMGHNFEPLHLQDAFRQRIQPSPQRSFVGIAYHNRQAHGTVEPVDYHGWVTHRSDLHLPGDLLLFRWVKSLSAEMIDVRS